MEFSNHGSVTRMANRITLRSCSSKRVKNQMEVNDRPKESGGDDDNTTKASKADGNTFKMVIYREMVYFLMSLNSGGTFSHCLCLFFNELEFRVKIARYNGHFLTLPLMTCSFKGCTACSIASSN